MSAFASRRAFSPARTLLSFVVVGAIAAVASARPAGSPAGAAAGSPAMTGEDLHRMFDAGKYRQVQTASQAALTLSPRDPSLYYWLARSSFELGVYDTAVTSAEEACRLDPQKSDFQMWLGRAYGRKAEIESSFFLARKTRRAFETAVKLDPSNIDARRNLEEFYMEAPWILGGSKDKARQQVDAITTIDARQGILALADYYWKADQLDEARKEYELLLAQHPDRMGYFIEPLDFYMHQRDALNLARVIDAAHAVAPHDPLLLYYRAVTRVIGGLELGQAETELKQFISEYPGRSDSVTEAEARDWLGTVYERQSKWQAAVEQYQQASQLEPYRKRFKKDLERALKLRRQNS